MSQYSVIKPWRLGGQVIIVFVDKKIRGVKIVDIPIPEDTRVKQKEFEKMEKYQLLRTNLGDYEI